MLKTLCLLSSAIFSACTPLLHGASITLGQDGAVIDADSMGKFTLEYPHLNNGNYAEAHKLVEKTIAGDKATLRYEGGASVTVAVEAGSKLRWTLAGIQPDVKAIQSNIQIPISYNQGGSWKVDAKQGEFPRQKPPAPHILQDHGKTFTLTNYEGKTLAIEPPEFTYHQVQDNREWNWPIFQWVCTIPHEPTRTDLVFTFTQTSPAAGEKPKPLVDKFGQATRLEWPEKVTSVEQMKADIEQEKTWYAATKWPAMDNFGGLAGSKEKLGLKATGFFHMEQKKDRWHLVDPEGNTFFHIGPCGMVPNDDFTLVTGREATYEWLPEDKGEFSSVFRREKWQQGTILSFHLVNSVRKYGEPYTGESYTKRMIDRLRRWGFNSVGAFTPIETGPEARKAAQFATVAHLPINVWEDVPRVPGIHETFDPFDEKVRAQVEKNLAAYLPLHAEDPLIIGWYIVNEPIYEQIPVIVPSLKGSEHACKRRLVAWLKEKYQDIAAFNKAWEASAGSFDDLLETGLTMKAAAAKQDAEAFASHFLDEYFKLVVETTKKYDKNHLILGSRLQPNTIAQEWICRAMGKWVDVMSFNYYTYGYDPVFMKRIYEWTGGKPMMLSEFFWSSPKDSGLDGGREVSSQQERGLAYRNYVEQAAASGFVVGIEWFTLVDQSVTGRWFSGFDGERANSGLIAVTDRPWKGMLDEMVKTNSTIYELLLGEKKPFVWDDPRFKAGK